MSGRTFFEDGRRIGAEFRHPVDELEPETESAEWSVDLYGLVEKVAFSFLTGNPEINSVAWRFLLGKQSGSMREHARRSGCSVAAISRQINRIARLFEMPLHTPHLRAARREITRASWKRRRQRAGGCRPAARMLAGESTDQGGRP